MSQYSEDPKHSWDYDKGIDSSIINCLPEMNVNGNSAINHSKLIKGSLRDLIGFLAEGGLSPARQALGPQKWPPNNEMTFL